MARKLLRKVILTFLKPFLDNFNLQNILLESLLDFPTMLKIKNDTIKIISDISEIDCLDTCFDNSTEAEQPYGGTNSNIVMGGCSHCHQCKIIELLPMGLIKFLGELIH